MKITNEAKVGVLIVIVLAVLAVLTIRVGNLNFSKGGYFVKVHFQNIDGVSFNAPVMLNGFEVGRVEDIRVVDEAKKATMELTVWLKDEAKIHEGAKAFVKNMGFMGEKYIGLTSGSPSKGYLNEGAVIAGTEPADFNQLVLEGKEIARNIKEITANLNERLELNKKPVDETIADLKVVMGNLARLSENVNVRIESNARNIDQILENLNSMTVNLDLMTYDLMKNPWKLLYRSKEKAANINQ